MISSHAPKGRRTRHASLPLFALGLAAGSLFADERDFVWVFVSAEKGGCEIRAEQLPCADAARYLKEQLHVPSTFTVYVNFYTRSDREVAISTQESIRALGYQDVEITSIGFVKEQR